MVLQRVRAESDYDLASGFDLLDGGARAVRRCGRDEMQTAAARECCSAFRGCQTGETA